MSSFPHIGMSPSVWGPIFWNTMHIVSLGYAESPTDAEKQPARQFFTSLTYMIPCPVCRDHYTKILEQLPIQADSRHDLVMWVFHVHNKVNAQLNYPQITLQEYIAKLTKLSQKTRVSFEEDSSVAGSLAVVVAAIGIGAGVYIWYQKGK